MQALKYTDSCKTFTYEPLRTPSNKQLLIWMNHGAAMSQHTVKVKVKPPTSAAGQLTSCRFQKNKLSMVANVAKCMF